MFRILTPKPLKKKCMAEHLFSSAHLLLFFFAIQFVFIDGLFLGQKLLLTKHRAVVVESIKSVLVIMPAFC